MKKYILVISFLFCFVGNVIASTNPFVLKFKYGDNEYYCIEGYHYRLDTDSTCSLTGASINGSLKNIPCAINIDNKNYTVTTLCQETGYVDDNYQLVRLPESIKEIKDYTFNYKIIENLEIPENTQLEKIGDYALGFENYTLGGEDKDVRIYHRTFFKSVPPSLKYIGYNFEGKHKNITIPSSIEELHRTFYRATVENLTFSDGQNKLIISNETAWWPEFNMLCYELYGNVYIGRSMEDGVLASSCYLSHVTIGPLVTTLSSVLFYGASIETISMLCKEPPTFNGSFDPFGTQIYENCILKVPSEAIEKYQQHEIWGKFKCIQGVASVDTTLVNINISIEGNIVRIAGCDGYVRNIYTIDGKCVYTGYDTEIYLTPGVYILQCGNSKHKFSIK